MMRLDLYIVDRGLCESRTAAQHLIAEGCVSVSGKVITKPSYQVEESDSIALVDNRKYVSRGGYKLKGALEAFGISVLGKTALDIGASTGGFTDCLLQEGAEYVYAVDSGKNQLAVRLLGNPKIGLREGCNARYLSREDFDRKIDIVTMDVSFISQKLILPSIFDILSYGGVAITLIKPQFEVGRSGLGKGGIVRDEKTRTQARDGVVEYARSIGFACEGTVISSIRGGDGNIEYLACFVKQKKEQENEKD